MCVLLGTGLPGFGQDGEGQDSFYMLDFPLYEDTIDYPRAQIEEVHLLNFQSKTVAYLKVGQPQFLLESGNAARLTKITSENPLSVPVSLTADGYFRVELDPNEVYTLWAKRLDGEWGKTLNLETRTKTGTEMIPVSAALNEALAVWESQEGANLYDVLAATPALSKYERYDFLQNFVKNGEPLLDIYMQGEIPPNAFILGEGPDDPPPPPPGAVECLCRVLNIEFTGDIYPTNSAQSDLMIHPIETFRTFGPDRVAFSESSRIAGPARDLHLHGSVTSTFCKNSHEHGEINDGDIPTARVRVQVRQTCRTGNWNPGWCHCDQKLSFRYRYNSSMSAFTRLRSMPCGNQSGKKAWATVEDLAIVSIIESTSPGEPRIYDDLTEVYSDAASQRAYSSCNQDFQEERILDFIKLGVSIFSYVVGKGAVKEFAGAIGAFIYQEYQKSNMLESLENLLTEPWVIADCGQMPVQRNTLDNTVPGITLKDANSLYFTLAVASRVEVGGLGHWESAASLRSGFSISVVLEKNENLGQENQYCCTRPAGIYQTATLDPDHTPDSYRGTIGTHFSGDLGCCFPVIAGTGQVEIGDNDRDILIGYIENDEALPCETTINHGLRRHDAGNTAVPETADELKVSALAGENLLLVEGLPVDEVYNLELFSVDGRLLHQRQINGEHLIALPSNQNQLPAGIYIIRLIRADGHASTHKILLR